MLKTSGSAEFKTQPGEGKVEVSSSRSGRSRSKLDGDELDGGEVNGSEIKGNKVEKKVQKSFKFKKLSKSKKTIGLDFLILRAKLAFTK